MAAELRLNVALDLQYFKAQLPKLARAAAGFQLPLQVKFDRRSLTNEFRLLGNQFSRRREYKIQVEDYQLREARKQAEKLVDYLKTNLTGKKHIVEIEYREKGRPGGGFAAGPQGAAGLMEFMRTQGASGGNIVQAGRQERFGKAVGDATLKQLQAMARQANLKGVSRLRKAELQKKLLEISGDLQEQILGNIKNQLRVPSGMQTSASGRPRFKTPGVGNLGRVSGVFPQVGATVGQAGLGTFGFAPRQLPGAGPQLALPSAQMRLRARLDAAADRNAAREVAVRTGDIASRANRTALPGGTGGGGRGRLNFTGGGMGMPSFPQLPGAGSVRELASEFSNATKQVLLFGTAYKGLAFLMDFPAQVGAAVGALQSFNNTLNAISPTAEAAADSNAFILDIVNRYNVPLQSARDGFTKLYASMAPAGFEGDQIKDIFLGISQAAATFGMSADKVDRMNYAFAQMASKGQIMSEELKGQLGDVLPGAMGIFAEAAGLEGPDAIQKFSKALEDGAFKGENMVALLKNVGQVMKDEFGPGAEGAARTFQGLMNRLQNSMKLLYEAFEPVAVQFLNAVVVPLTKGIKTITDGITAYFNKTAASTKEGQAFANQLKSLESTFEGIKTNVLGVVDVFKQFGQSLGPVVRMLLEIAGSPIVGYLARLYAIVLPLNMALGVMRGAFVATNVQLLIFKTRLLMGTKSLTAFRGMMAMTGASAATTAASIRGVGVALKAALGSTVVGAIVVGLGMLIEKIVTLRSKMDEVKRAAQEASAAIAHMGRAEAVQTKTQAEQDLVTLRGLRQRSGGKYSHVATTDAEQAALERAGVTTNKFKDRTQGGAAVSGVMGQAIDRAISSTAERLATSRSRIIALDKSKADQDTALQAELQEISLQGDGDGKGKRQMTADELTVVEAINQKRREGNDLAVAHLEFAQELLDIRNSDLDANERAAKLDTARTDHAEKIKKINEDNAKKIAKALEEQTNSRHTLKQIVLEAKLASGEISEEEYKVQKFLLEQEATRRRIAGLPGLTQEERDAATGAVNQMKPPQEKGDAAQWIEKTEEELTNFEGMAVSVADNVSSEFGSMFSDIMSGTTSIQEGLSNAFANISKMFADMVAQMLMKWAMLQVMKSIFPGMADGGVVSAASNGVVPKMANGGIVKGPTMAMVGEGRYNEAVVPLPNGKSIPVEMGKGAGGDVNSSVVVNINNSGAAQSSSKGAQGNQLAKGIEGAVKDVIMREMRPGGMIASRR